MRMRKKRRILKNTGKKKFNQYKQRETNKQQQQQQKRVFFHSPILKSMYPSPPEMTNILFGFFSTSSSSCSLSVMAGTAETGGVAVRALYPPEPVCGMRRTLMVESREVKHMRPWLPLIGCPLRGGRGRGAVSSVDRAEVERVEATSDFVNSRVTAFERIVVHGARQGDWGAAF